MSRPNPSDADVRTAPETTSAAFGYDLTDECWLLRIREALEDESGPGSALPEARFAGRIGPYELIDEIGRGGMGSVWRARRIDGAYDRDVAIKLIRPGLDSDQILQRFQLERQVLARLEHPGIARLYDGGTAGSGQPYLVLELVDGTPIDAYCRARKLEIDATLALFQRVCQAVHFAHSNLVLHRDIKPGNVLVSPSGVVKLLDFGIAKLLDDHDQAITQTRDNPILTPRYASPEQIRGEQLATSSDVYSLGVMLYELLTTESPYEPNTSSRAAIESAALEHIPRSASEAVRRSDQSSVIRRVRARQLRGDVDAVLAKALEKKPEDRYASAEQFGEDIRRLREGLPLIARGPGPLRRLRQAWRQNQRAVLASGMLMGLVLMLGSMALSYSLLAPRWAEQRLRSAHQVFLTPGIANYIWILSFNNASDLFNRNKAPACRNDVATRALEEYDAALRFDPTREDVQIERHAVWLATEITNHVGQEPAVPADLLRTAPLTCEYTRQWAVEGAIPELEPEALAEASRADLRALGFVALLCGDPRTCLLAWQRLGEVEADPLVEALLGLLHLTRDAPELAYPRLLSAYRAYPELGFLATYLADAALGCGDIEFARELLDRAETLDHQDPQRALQRVRLKYYTATGQDELAKELFYEEGAGVNFVARFQYARYLFHAEGQRKALQVLVEGCSGAAGTRQVPASMMRSLFELTQGWWAQQSDTERRETLADSIHESCDNPGSMFRILHAYATSVRRSERYHRERALAGGGSALAEDPLLTTETHAELLALHDLLQIDQAHRWGLFQHYPPHLQTKQVRAWLDAPDPIAATRQIDEAFVAWQRDHGRPLGNASQKLLPGVGDGGAFGRYVDIDGDIAVVTTADGAIAYRNTRGTWLREEMDLPAGTAVQEAVVDSGRIFTLMSEKHSPGDPATRLGLFRYREGSGAWAVDEYLPLPQECPLDARVAVDGDTACVAAVKGPVFLFAHPDGDGVWQLEHELRRNARVKWCFPSLAEGTLAIIDQEADSTLFILHRAADGNWSVEAEMPPPAGTTWHSTTCSGEEVIASAANNANEPLELPVLVRDDAGAWQTVTDLIPGLPPRAWYPGQLLATDGFRLAMTTGDRGRHARRIEVLERVAGEWTYLAKLDPGDLGFGDLGGPPAITGQWVILGTPRHDAVEIDGGAAYLFRVPTPAR